MSEHERTITLKVPREEVFRYVSSVSNLSSFVPHLKNLREDENDHVFGIAEFDGRRYEVSGFFRADEANWRLDWEADGTPGYSGWMQIDADGANRSRATVHLSMRGAAAETPPSHAGLAPERIERSLDSVLETMRHQVEDAVHAR